MFDDIVNDAAGFAQSAGRLTAERAVAGLIPAIKKQAKILASFAPPPPQHTHHTISPPMVKRFPESFVRHIKLHFYRIPRIVLACCCNRVNH